MRTLADASLSDRERRVLEKLDRLLQDELGEELRSVWLYGSRARGERPQEVDRDKIVLAGKP